MLTVSRQQMADFQRLQRQSFVDAQPERLRANDPKAFVAAFQDEAAAAAFVEQVLEEAARAGVDDCTDLEAFLDACLGVGWLTPEARSAAGVDAMLADPRRSAAERVTGIVNAAAFAAASDEGLR